MEEEAQMIIMKDLQNKIGTEKEDIAEIDMTEEMVDQETIGTETIDKETIGNRVRVIGVDRNHSKEILKIHIKVGSTQTHQLKSKIFNKLPKCYLHNNKVFQIFLRYNKIRQLDIIFHKYKHHKLKV